MSTIAKGISAHLSAVEKAEVRENIGTNSVSEIDDKDALKVNLTDETYYQQDNILGTVSQTAGVPTGAIIERGSNANGEYVKFADGAMICTSPYINHTSSAVNNFAIGAYGWSFYSESTTWPFPATFISQPTVSASAGENIAGAAIGGLASVEAISTTHVGVSTWRMDSTLTRVKCSAIGRWW